MIRIIKGAFGWSHNGRITLLSSKSGPVQLPENIERQLVEKDRIAEYVPDIIEVEFTETSVESQPDPALAEKKAPVIENLSFGELGQLLLEKGVPAETVNKLKSKKSRTSYLRELDEDAPVIPDAMELI